MITNVKIAARSLGVELLILEARGPDEFDCRLRGDGQRARDPMFRGGTFVDPKMLDYMPKRS